MRSHLKQMPDKSCPVQQPRDWNFGLIQIASDLQELFARYLGETVNGAGGRNAIEVASIPWVLCVLRRDDSSR